MLLIQLRNKFIRLSTKRQYKKITNKKKKKKKEKGKSETPITKKTTTYSLLLNLVGRLNYDVARYWASRCLYPSPNLIAK